jgi:hypothetical protein
MFKGSEFEVHTITTFCLAFRVYSLGTHAALLAWVGQLEDAVACKWKGRQHMQHM